MSLIAKMVDQEDNSQTGGASLQDVENLWYGGEIYNGDDFFDKVFKGGDEDTAEQSDEDQQEEKNTSDEENGEEETPEEKEKRKKSEKRAKEKEDEEENGVDKMCEDCDSKFIGGSLPAMGGLDELAKLLRNPPKQNSFQEELAKKAGQIQGGSKRKNNIEDCSEEVTKVIRSFSSSLKL